MGKRSLQVQEQYKEKAEKAFITLGLTQETFAQRLELSRSTVSRFFNCKPIYIENFVTICDALKLDWEEITGLKERVGNDHLTEMQEDKQQSEIDIELVVNQIREQVKEDIETRCGTMRILDMSQPIGLGEIYTKVNILEKIIGRTYKEITQLIENWALP